MRSMCWNPRGAKLRLNLVPVGHLVYQTLRARHPCIVRSMCCAVYAWRGPGSEHIDQGHNIQGTLCPRGATSKNFRSGTHRSGTHQPCIPGWWAGSGAGWQWWSSSPRRSSGSAAAPPAVAPSGPTPPLTYKKDTDGSLLTTKQLESRQNVELKIDAVITYRISMVIMYILVFKTSDRYPTYFVTLLKRLLKKSFRYNGVAFQTYQSKSDSKRYYACPIIINNFFFSRFGGRMPLFLLLFFFIQYGTVETFIQSYILHS